MKISDNYVLVEKVISPINGDEFKVVEVQDDYVYKGKVMQLPERQVFMGSNQVNVGDIVLFAKYSPDTHEIEFGDKKLKFVAVADLLALL